jgi:ParB/RepB/Spo0J family partition protein
LQTSARGKKDGRSESQTDSGNPHRAHQARSRAAEKTLRQGFARTIEREPEALRPAAAGHRASRDSGFRGGDSARDYVIVDGERRWRAAQLAGLRFYRAILTDRSTRGEWFEESVISNFGREDHTPIEILNAILRLRSESGMTIEQIAESMAKSSSWVNQHLLLLRLDERVRRMVDETLPEEQQLGYSTAIFVVAKIEDKDRQLEAALHIVKHRLGLYEARTYVAKLGNARGFLTRRKKPSDDLPVLENFVKRLMADSEFVLTLRQADFSAILQTRSLAEVGKLRAALGTAMYNLQAIGQAVDRVIDSRQAKVREFALRKMA